MGSSEILTFHASSALMHGKVIMAFSIPLGQVTSNQAEAEALLFDLNGARTMGSTLYLR